MKYLARPPFFCVLKYVKMMVILFVRLLHERGEMFVKDDYHFYFCLWIDCHRP